MTFKQAMIVPTMMSLGIGALLVAKNLSLMEVSYAAPATAGVPAVPGAPGAGGAKGRGAANPGPGTLPLPPGGAISPEFAPQAAAAKVIKAVTDIELTQKAVEASGREDPFMALVPPDPTSIAPPPVTLTPLRPIPELQPLTPQALPKPPGAPTVKPPAAAAPPVKPKPVDLPFAGDKPPAAAEPQWLVRGIMSTGGDRVTLLEGKDETVHARVGDVLSDGSKIIAITSRGVTFVRGGRNFVKLIGGNN